MTTWDFHTLTVAGGSNDERFFNHWTNSFSSRPVDDNARPDIMCVLDVVDKVPPAPDSEPDFRQGELLAYYVKGNTVVAHFPRYGQLVLDLNLGVTLGDIHPVALETYGVIEDLIAIGLSPHLKRRGQFLVHAFSAAWEGEAVLLVGGIGAGKTTTGMSLLNAGWQLLSNDSPIIMDEGITMSYPGVLAGYPETFARFPTCAHLAAETPEMQLGRQKLLIQAEQIWPDVWLDKAPVKAIVFPVIEERETHLLEPISTPDTLRRLLPHAVEQWDRPMIPKHLAVLRSLVDNAQGYILHLSPDVLAIPDVLRKGIF